MRSRPDGFVPRFPSVACGNRLARQSFRSTMQQRAADPHGSEVIAFFTSPASSYITGTTLAQTVNSSAHGTDLSRSPSHADHAPALPAVLSSSTLHVARRGAGITSGAHRPAVGLAGLRTLKSASTWTMGAGVRHRLTRTHGGAVMPRILARTSPRATADQRWRQEHAELFCGIVSPLPRPWFCRSAAGDAERARSRRDRESNARRHRSRITPVKATGGKLARATAGGTR